MDAGPVAAKALVGYAIGSRQWVKLRPSLPVVITAKCTTLLDME
jgi:hypothetical protein